MPADNYNKINLNRREMIINNFLGGLSWAIGASIGFSLLIAILGFIAAKAGLIPIVGTFVSQIIDFVLEHNPSLR